MVLLPWLGLEQARRLRGWAGRHLLGGPLDDARTPKSIVRRDGEVLTAICGNLIDPYLMTTGLLPEEEGPCRFRWATKSTEGTSMDEKWRMSRDELLEGGAALWFVLYDQKGRPSVVRRCGPREAEAGPQCVAALGGVEQVVGRWVKRRKRKTGGVDLPETVGEWNDNEK